MVSVCMCARGAVMKRLGRGAVCGQTPKETRRVCCWTTKENIREQSLREWRALIVGTFKMENSQQCEDTILLSETSLALQVVQVLPEWK